MPSLIQEIDQEILELPEIQQRQVLDFVRQLRSPRLPGVRGDQMLRFTGMFSAEDATSMLASITEGCGRIDHDGW